MEEKHRGDEQKLKSKVALITGGSRGIGFAIAERLLEEGMKVAICGMRQNSVDTAVSKLGSSENVFGVAADVSKLDDVSRLVRSTSERFGAIGVLIHSAGVGYFRSVAALEPAEWDRMIGINLTGAYYCSRAVLPIFQAAGAGDAIFIGSLAGKNTFAGGAGYNASKFGLNGFAEALMLDHRHDGIRVTTIMPGSVDTGFAGHAPNSDSEWKIAPRDITNVVVMLLEMPRRTTVSSVEIRPSKPPKR